MKVYLNVKKTPEDLGLLYDILWGLKALCARLYYDKALTQALLSKSHLHSGVMQSDGRGLSFLARSIWHMFLLEDFPTFPTQLYIINQLLKGFFI